MADAKGRFASSLFLLLTDLCLAGGGPLRSDVEPQLAGSEESRESGTELRSDDCFDVDRTGTGATAELTTEDDSEADALGVFGF